MGKYIYFMIALCVLTLDQVSKYLVVRYMDLGQSISLIEPFLSFTSHRNAGAAFGILQNQRIFFLIVTTVVVIGIIYYMLKLKPEKRRLAFSLSIILGGASGNFIDRLLFGEVVDFIDVYIKLGNFSWDYAIFNIADSALVIGVSILLIDTLIDIYRERKAQKVV